MEGVNHLKKMGEIITRIEEAGVNVKGAWWLENGHLYVDVDDHEKAIEIMKESGFAKE